MPRPARDARGYLLIEVLVALVIMAVGLLGIAGLQAVAMTKGNSSLLRGKATQLGYEMGDRIRANAPGVTAGSYNSLTGTPSDPGCIGTGCTPAQLAAWDYFSWRAAVAQALPGGTGVVCTDSTPDDGVAGTPACDGVGPTLAVKVFWSEKNENFTFAVPVRP